MSSATLQITLHETITVLRTDWTITRSVTGEIESSDPQVTR